MAHTLPELPYAKEALEPSMSAETLEYHYGKHHAGYVTKLNNALEGTGLESESVESLLGRGELPPGVFNNAAQHFNHSFFWKCLSPNGGGEPTGALAKKIEADFGSYSAFKEAFTKEATTHFASGWAWLVEKDGKLQVISTHDADTPVAHGIKPLLTCDVWEHAYYIDYRNDRAKFIQNFWNLVNWDFVSSNL